MSDKSPFVVQTKLPLNFGVNTVSFRDSVTCLSIIL